MIKIYTNLCKKGVKTFNDVPAEFQDEVKELLEADGYIINEDGTVERG